DHLPHLDAGHIVSGDIQGVHQDCPHLALPAEEQDLHAARATASGLIRSTAARKRFSLGPMPAAESRSGAYSSRARAAISSDVTAAMRRSVSSIGTISVPVTVALPSRLILADVDS